MIEELGLAYEVHSLKNTKGEQFRPEFLALNVKNKIAVLTDTEGERGGRLVSYRCSASFVTTDATRQTRLTDWRYQAETRRLYAVLNLRLDASPHLNGDVFGIANIVAYSWVARPELRDLD